MKGAARTTYLVGSLLLALAGGCGENTTTTATPTSTLAASRPCIDCHTNAVSPGTGAVIPGEWRLSAHNTASPANRTGAGAACGDCHEPDAGHPNSCSRCHGGTPSGSSTRHDVTLNPDTSLKCFKCHGPTTLGAPHFNNNTSAGFPASYVSSMYVGNCRKCHNPHNPAAKDAKGNSIDKQWADSGHGDPRSGAHARYDFKTRGSYEPVNLTFQYYCVRCHTSTGYVKFVTSGFTDIAPFAGPGYPVVQNVPPTVSPTPPDRPSSDKSKETTNCDVCHDDGNGNAYGFKLRTVPPVRIYYNVSTAWAVSKITNTTVKLNNSPVDYPDKGASNMCIPCHAGRGVGQLIKAAAAAGLDFSSAPSSISAHDRDAAATLARHGGYEYDGRDYANPDEYLHEKVGIGNTQGTGTRGPCITCHMKSDASHSFEPVKIDPTTGVITTIVSRTCASCHNGSLKPAWTPQTLQAQRAGFQAALTALSRLRTVRVVPKPVSTPNPKNLYNWEFQFGAGSGPNTMGANFNYSLLVNELGAFAHNSTYVKRLIYDSIDWLNDGVLNNDVEAAINALTYPAGTKNPVTGIVYTAQELANLNATAIGYLINGPGGQRP